MSRTLASVSFSAESSTPPSEKAFIPGLIPFPSTLSSLLLGELLLLERLRTKNASQHRSAIFFQRCQEIERFGKRIYEQVLLVVKVQDRAQDESGQSLSDENVAVILRGARKRLKALLHKALPALTRATDSINKMLHHLHFVPVTSLLLAIYARLWSVFIDMTTYLEERQPSTILTKSSLSTSVMTSLEPSESSWLNPITDEQFVAAGFEQEQGRKDWLRGRQNRRKQAVPSRSEALHDSKDVTLEKADYVSTQPSDGILHKPIQTISNSLTMGKQRRKVHETEPRSPPQPIVRPRIRSPAPIEKVTTGRTMGSSIKRKESHADRDRIGSKPYSRSPSVSIGEDVVKPSKAKKTEDNPVKSSKGGAIKSKKKKASDLDDIFGF